MTVKTPAFFVPPPLTGVDVHPVFFFLYPPPSTGLFQERVPPSYFASAARVPIEEATAIVIPNNFKYTDARIDAYIQSYADMAERYGLPLYIFACGDFTEQLIFDPRALVFRYSLYRSALQPQDISIPTVTEDLGMDGISYRTKSDRPTISFCGKADFPTVRSRIAYYVKNVAADLRSVVQPIHRARKVGIYWRRRAIAVCKKSALLRTNFIIRSSFSGSKATIELDPGRARTEFIDSVVESDFVLAPKGDGNYSNRFLEALSLGRIPVIVETDVVLPLEHIIAYDRCVVRIPMRDVSRMPEYIRAWYDALDETQWKEAQAYARYVYATYLRIDTYFTAFFASETQRT